jgi:tetratricopeptide (TPR) repeat protein
MITQAFKNTKPEVLANNNLLATDVLVNAEKLKDEAELDPLGQSLLLETITNSLIALHEYELALPVAESRTQVCINAFGKLDPESLRARIRQADCIQFCGRKNDSFQFRADIKDEVRNAYGQGHIEYRRLLVAQGKLFLEMQNWRRAINNLESGAIGLEESLGKDDPETISALHSLAEANAGFMDYEHASKVRKKLHEHYVRVNGLNDEQTLRAKQHLGYAYVRNNNVGVGISLLKEAVQDVDIVHPGNSAKKNSTMNYLALGYQMANKVDEEVRVREGALEYSLEHFGRHHPYHVYAKARLSRAYRRAKQIEKSDALIQTIDIDESKSETWTKHSIDQLDIAATNLFNDDKDELALRLYKIVFNARVRMLGRANTLTFETEGSIALATFYTGDKLEGLRQIMALYDRGREQVGRRNYRVRHISEKWNFMANHFVSSLPRMIANDENEQAEEILKLLVRYEGEEQQDILEESFELLHSIYLKQKRFEEAQKVVDSWIKFLNENKGIGIGRHYELETVVARPKELNEKLLAWARTSKARCELGLGAFLDAEKTANDALSNEFITAANQSRCEVVIAVCEAEAGSSIDAKKRAVDAFNKIESRRSSATVDLLWFYTDACENIIRICESANDAEGVKLWKMKLKKLEEENRNAKRKFVRRTPETSLYPSQTN